MNSAQRAEQIHCSEASIARFWHCFATCELSHTMAVKHGFQWVRKTNPYTRIHFEKHPFGLDQLPPLSPLIEAAHRAIYLAPVTGQSRVLSIATN